MSTLGPFWERKIRTYVRKLDKSGKVTKQSYERLGDRYVELGKLNDLRGKQVKRKLIQVWYDFFNELSVDGALTEDGFIQSLRNRGAILPKVVDQFFEMFFDLIDQNGDGFIQKEEFSLLFKVFQIDDASAEEAFKMIDSNGDGKLSLDEFMTMSREFWLTDDESFPSKYMFGPLVE